jgi:hypothetical protein
MLDCLHYFRPVMSDVELSAKFGITGLLDCVQTEYPVPETLYPLECWTLDRVQNSSESAHRLSYAVISNEHDFSTSVGHLQVVMFNLLNRFTFWSFLLSRCLNFLSII